MSGGVQAERKRYTLLCDKMTEMLDLGSWGKKEKIEGKQSRIQERIGERRAGNF